jgi:hypothetical protein
VTRGKARTPAIHGVVHLAPQVFVVLSGDPGYDAIRITLPGSSVTAFAPANVHARSVSHQLTTAEPGGRRIVELADIAGDIGNSLRIRNPMRGS